MTEPTETAPEELAPEEQATQESVETDPETVEVEETVEEITRDIAKAQVQEVPASERDSEPRIDHRNLPEAVTERLHEHDAEVGVIDRAGRGLFEARFTPELREMDDDTYSLRGYATVYGHPYDVAGGPPWGWVETMERGAADRSVSERDDVRLLVNHAGLPLARTRSGTLKLTSDEIGLRVEVENLDTRSPTVRDVISAMKRGDLDEMSIGFRVLQDEWNDEYTERRINEIMLFDVSVVTYPANPLAVATLREDEKELETAEADEVKVEEPEVEEPEVEEVEEVVESGMSLRLALALVETDDDQ